LAASMMVVPLGTLTGAPSMVTLTNASAMFLGGVILRDRTGPKDLFGTGEILRFAQDDSISEIHYTAAIAGSRAP
jgi:hypothetical protein